jgi:hypothetical protein
MNKDMERSYLIQRLMKPTDPSPFSFGGTGNGGIGKDNLAILNKVFSFDYMGAAEFEFGAVPETFNRIIENASDFVKGSMKVHWKALQWKTRKMVEGNGEVYFLCHKEQRKEVKKRIAGWAMGDNLSGHPKCGVRLCDSFDDQKYHGWFELDNGFFFFTDKTMWENTCGLFELPEKKKAKK